MKKLVRIIITLALAASLCLLASCKEKDREPIFPGLGDGGIQGPMVEHNPK
ncbi:MAG: hypothetical protein J6V09_02550 [Clostridia bacterium]|nr:hypothetical protein [Clostridia bacterium]